MATVLWEGIRVQPGDSSWDGVIWFKLAEHSNHLVTESDIAVLKVLDENNFPIKVGEKFRLIIEKVEE